jgi:hypothetical protein
MECSPQPRAPSLATCTHHGPSMISGRTAGAASLKAKCGLLSQATAGFDPATAGFEHTDHTHKNQSMWHRPFLHVAKNSNEICLPGAQTSVQKNRIAYKDKNLYSFID